MSDLSRLLGTVRARIVLGYVAVMLVLAGAWAWNLFGPLSATVIDQQTESLRGMARAGAFALGESGLGVTERFAEGTDLRATVIAADGTVLADTQEDPATMENHAGRPEVRAALADGEGTDSRRSETQSVEQLYAAARTSLDGEPVVFRVSRSLERIKALDDRAQRAGLAFLVVALAVSAAVAYRLSAVPAAPIRRLTAAAKSLAAGSLATPVPKEAGELAVLSEALSSLGANIRERMALLEDEKADLRTVLNGLNDGVLLLEEGRVRLANDGASSLFGAPPGGWRDAALSSDVVPASLSREVGERLGDEVASWTWGPDPRGRFVAVTVLPLSAARGKARHLAVFSDITEGCRLDSVRRHFVSNASHELKTPVAGIRLLAESAASAAAESDWEAAVSFTSQLEGEAARLSQLVGDLLDLARLEGTRAESEMTDMRRAIELSVTSHKNAAERAGLTIEIDVSAVEGEDVFVMADPTDVAIALDNAVDNAVAYTEEGGVRIAVGASDTEVTIEVTDTGMGIPEEALDRVFERFFRVDRARSRSTGGTGLGLSLVKHSVERNGGRVTLESEVGRGTTVRLTLPRAR